MRKRFATTLLAAAALAGLCGVAGYAPAQSAPPAGENRQANGNQPANAADQAQIPVRQVVLYSSGVGYFEHFGTVSGTRSAELTFKTQQINDILKSLVLQDMDNGKVGVITYPSQDPIAKLLRSFQIDITNNPSLADLLNQLRGARVTINAGAEQVTGTILGVERKPRPVGGGDDAKVVELPFVNLVTDGGIRSIPLDDVRSFELQDARLREELKRALEALAAARDQDKKPVNIRFEGEGERRVRIGYVVETPVWKMSYRLVLPGGADAKPDGQKVGDDEPKINLGGAEFEGKPAGDKPGDGKAGDKPADGAAAGPAGKSALQGWAVVENQTDLDWSDVQLSLVSGRPISFIMDLYQPLYIPRPTVQPELYASLRPQTYEGGIAAGRELEERFEQKLEAAAETPPAPAAAPGMANAPTRGAARLNEQSGADMAKQADRQSLPALDALQSVSSVASAAKVGELFQYTVGNVSLPRQSSAMIPVITDTVEVERLSIYNVNVLARNPLLGARVKNTSGKYLLQGPITVYTAGSYVGDARIDDVPPGQDRLISYGIDQQVVVLAENNQQESAVQTGKIVNGVLHLTRKLVNSRDYVADNKADSAKTLIIEHPKLGGEWKLVEPEKADEVTDDLYRFKGTIASGKSTKLTVRQEQITTDLIAILPLNDAAIAGYIRTGAIPQDVRDALAKAAELKQALATTQQQIQEKQREINQITQEQSRIRENMKTVAQNTDYYNRLLTKLGEQESRIEKLQSEIAELQKKAEQQRKALEDYLKGLNVG